MLLPLLDDPRTPCSTMLHCGARSHKREITNRSTEIGVVWVGKAIWIRKENLHTRKKKKIRRKKAIRYTMLMVLRLKSA